MPITNPWSDTLRLPLRARQAVGGPGVPSAASPRAAAHLELSFHAPTPRVQLASTELSEQTIAEWLTQKDDPKKRRLALNALNDRMQLFGDVLTGNRTVRLAGGESSFPDVKHEGLPVAVELTDANRQRVDTRWAALYNVQDRRSEPWPGYFKIRDLYHAVSVRQYQPGERIQLGSIEAEETILEHYLYGTGLQWNQLLMAGRWERQEGMTAMLIKWANNLAKLAYTNITAAGLSTTAYVNDDGSNAVSLQNDIATINQAALDIRKALFEAQQPTSGDEVEEVIPEGQAYYLLYNNHTQGYEDRITAALEVRYQTVQGGSGLEVKEVNRPIIPIGSPYVPTGAWYMTIGGRKNVFSVFRDLRFFDFMDARIAGVAEGEVGWGANRFVRGDANQGREVAVAP